MTATQDEKHKATLTGFLKEVWSDGAIERCDAYLAESYTIHHDPGDPWEGRSLDVEGFKARVALSPDTVSGPAIQRTRDDRRGWQGGCDLALVGNTRRGLSGLPRYWKANHDVRSDGLLLR